MNVGREIVAFNGNGYEYPAVISAASKKAATITVNEAIHAPRQSPIEIELAIGLSKGDRFDWVLQKATELGVSSIVPLKTERSEIKLQDDRLEKKLASWQGVIVAACEQCQRNILPQLSPPQSFEDYIQQCEKQHKFVLHHRSDKSLAEHAQPTSVSVCIGPEGGLSDTEIALAIQNDFAPLTLGPRVMRTETAPIAALSILQYLWGDI